MTLKRVELDGDAVVLRVKDGEFYKDLVFVRAPTPQLKNVWQQLAGYHELLERDKV